ncbi:hypothetical protein [Arthrobacter sp. ISL-95]|uniref:hypothetical protein n=1 Tax=Arthrobacter sp. ISL-95 TaxID=2819116 RepID=UPI001BE6DF9D|nr:hypothetical protein [Arthrobacter sp. ISL-95]MBT2586528.1 hypothetical protein [Arthrobacter sp. ISL-95]
MSITEATLIALLNLHDVPQEFHPDPELRAVAYALAALEEPTSEVERRFYDAETTLPADAPDEIPRQVTNRELLTEIHQTRLSNRLHQLHTPERKAG